MAPVREKPLRGAALAARNAKRARLEAANAAANTASKPSVAAAKQGAGDGAQACSGGQAAEKARALCFSGFHDADWSLSSRRVARDVLSVTGRANKEEWRW